MGLAHVIGLPTYNSWPSPRIGGL